MSENRNGTLTVVGLGPGRPELMTQEAHDCFRQAAGTDEARVYGFSSVRDLVAAVAPDLQLRLLDPYLDAAGDNRAQAYNQAISKMMLDAFKDGRDVYYLVQGSPLVVNDLVFFLRRACHRYKKPVRIVHGVSFVDLVLDRVYWRADPGLQLFSAWSFARGQGALDPTSSALFYELGEATDPESVAPTEGQGPGMLAALSDRLQETLPPDHPVMLLYSSGPPDFESLSRCFPLSELVDQPLVPLSNLWVPALQGEAAERDEVPG
jgi:tetrapyrrole methylase family protein/MazG family protein